jgi:hypothetical protein
MTSPMLISKVFPYATSRPLKDIMFDMETLGKRAGCPILTIGAVAFDPYAPYDGVIQSISRENQFFARIDLSTCKEAGLVADPATEKWWQDQSPEAVAEAFGGTTPLRVALEGFRDWLFELCGKNPDEEALCNVWSHGEDFDQPILNHAYEVLGMKKPWPYNGGRDTRTALEMGSVRYKGTAHMAVQDAIDQADAVRKAFANLSLAQDLRT